MGPATTVLVNSTITVIDNQPNWGLVLSADTTLGGLKVQITGASSTTIKWAAPIQCAEVYIPITLRRSKIKWLFKIISQKVIHNMELLLIIVTIAF